MAIDDFRSCAAATLGAVVESWSVEVVQALAPVCVWFTAQDPNIQWLFDTVIGNGGPAAMAWITQMAPASTEAVAAILMDFAGTSGMTSSLTAVADCAAQL